jgi:hypothetical protein
MLPNLFGISELSKILKRLFLFSLDFNVKLPRFINRGCIVVVNNFVPIGSVSISIATEFMSKS